MPEHDPPPGPMRDRAHFGDEGTLALGTPLEWVADVMVHPIAVGADEVPDCFIKADASSLGLDDENAHDDEGGLAVAGLTEKIVVDPLDVVEDEPVVTQLASEGIIKLSLGRAFDIGIEGNRVHPSRWKPS